MSTPLHAVYQLAGLDKELIEVYPSRYDMRYYLERMKVFVGIKGAVTEDDLPKVNPMKLSKELPEMRAAALSFVNSLPPYDIMHPGRDKTVALSDSVLDPRFPKAAR